MVTLAKVMRCAGTRVESKKALIVGRIIEDDDDKTVEAAAKDLNEMH